MSLTIRYGFLADSLFDGWSEDEMASIDRDASVRSFAQQVEDAIREEHGGADIEVVWQSGRSGVKPADLSTLFIDSNAPDEYYPDYLEALESIAGEVYEKGLWHAFND